MAKEKSFAEKVKKTKGKDKQLSVVKYVKSVVSQKTGQYRFQEKMLKVPAGTNVQSFIDEMEKGFRASEESEKEAVLASKAKEPEIEEKDEDVQDAALPKENEKKDEG